MKHLEKSEIVELKQLNDRMTRDPAEYFKRFDKLLPSGLAADNTVLLYKIDNIGCISKIIARNPQAKYTVFGNKYVNDALKLLKIPNIVSYHDSTTKFNDKHQFDHTAFDYSCYEWHPDSSSPVDFFKVGLVKGDKLVIVTADGKTVRGTCEVYDNRQVMSNGNLMSLGNFWNSIFVKGINLKCGSHTSGMSIYPNFIWSQRLNKTIKQLYYEYLKDFCVTKNR